MELKGVGTVPMGCVLFQVTWKVDDADSLKGTFLGIGTPIMWCRAYPLTRVVLTFTQMPHPMHNCSEMVAILSAGVTSMHSFPAERQGGRETGSLSSLVTRSLTTPGCKATELNYLLIHS